MPICAAMQHYYFHINEPPVRITDEEGIKVTDLASAIEYAISGARAIMADDVVSGRLRLNCFIDVVDVKGDLLSRVLFRDLVCVTGY